MVNAVMMVSLAILGIVSAINIDNELRIIKIDCYERLAIGQRLNSKNVYKTSKHNIVGDCKKICSEEKMACKAFSFGIAAKGNATCELSTTTIKDSPDSKPLGTVPDTDFDLYIKKPGCTVVSEKSSRPSSGIPGIPPKFHETGQEDVHNVQTLVSVASGPQTVLNPFHGILVASEENKNNAFGHEALPYWYNDEYKHFQEHYGLHSDGFGIDEDIIQFNKPSSPISYEDIDRFDNGFIFNRYAEKPPDRPYFPKSDYLRYPTPEKYGSVIPHPDYYYKRPTHNDYPYPVYRPNHGMVDYQYKRPSKPFSDTPRPANVNYHQETSKPVSLSLIYEIENTKRPQTEISYPEPPKKLFGYGSNGGTKEKPVENSQEYNGNPITTTSTGYNGEQITSIITEIKKGKLKWY